ncbi:MAG: DUF2892 domain-containing protein [Candidatus Eremiobacteraeota bacterium]|nr:DUF2892 domain-containing protein [Candidatus Eremiobacteraeota bacterium]
MVPHHNPIVSWTTSEPGRYVQIALGAVLMLLAIFLFRDELEFFSFVLGAVLIGAGLLNLCLFAPLFGESIAPWRSKGTWM